MARVPVRSGSWCRAHPLRCLLGVRPSKPSSWCPKELIIHLIQYLVGEKLRDWVDEPLDLDVVLELVTMWWIQETFPTSIYAYSEVSISDYFTLYHRHLCTSRDIS